MTFSSPAASRSGRRLLNQRVGVLGAERHEIVPRRARLECGAHGVDLCGGPDGEG